MNDQWIKFSDRKPTKEEYPVWAESPEWNEPEKPGLFFSEEELINQACIRPRFWLRAYVPDPPPKENNKK